MDNTQAGERLHTGHHKTVFPLQDVGGRKKAREAQAWLAAIVESSGDAIIGKTLGGVITSWNPGAQNIYGYTAEEVLGQHVSTLVPPEQTGKITEALEKTGHGERVEGFETECFRKDGRRFHASITISPVRAASGEIVGLSTIARDVTGRIAGEREIKRLKEDLEKELAGKLAAARREERRRIAHDIHDGLTQAAVAAHQVLRVFARAHPPGSTVEKGSLDRALTLARSVVREARHVIEDLRPGSLEEFGLAAALCRETEVLREKGWQVTCEGNLGEERLDPEIETALYRVATEALTNVRKHARTSRVTVRLTRNPERVRLEVADKGRGFDPSASLVRGRGEKVGLAGMRERVALLGGRLQVKSRPGEGTTILAEVPLEGLPEGLS